MASDKLKKGIAETLLDAGVSATLPAAQSKTRPASPSARPSAAMPDDHASLAVDETDVDDLVAVDPSMYAFVRWFAEGGMGRIAEVRDRRLGRVVAIKELVVSSPEMIGRFKREAFITAQLQHPAIVSVHEAGLWPDGNPFFAMRLVEGQSLKEALAETSDYASRLELLSRVITVADALAYAHSNRVIHRDLKPANILVGDHGETVVIDWGLAKDLSQDADEFDPVDSLLSTATAGMTVAGSIMGTPGYMAPEQARGEAADERADVYALGAILYELLTGAAPYTGDTSDSVVAQVVGGPPVPIAERSPEVAGDLATIVTTAMARDPIDRYDSAVELAADLRRFRTGRLVAAHDYSRSQLLRRWLAKHRAAVAVAVTALLVVFGLSAIGISRIVSERDDARDARDAATLATAEAQKRAERLTVAQAKSQVAVDPVSALELISSLPATSPAWAAAREVASTAARQGLPTVKTIKSDAGNVVLPLSDGQHALVLSKDRVRVVEVESGREQTLKFAPRGFEIVQDGRRLALRTEDGSVSVFSLPDLELITKVTHLTSGIVVEIEMNAAGSHLVTVGFDKTTKVWDLGTGEIVSEYPAMLASPTFSANGKWIIGIHAYSDPLNTGKSSGQLVRLTTSSSDSVVIPERRGFTSVGIDNGGNTVVAGHRDGTVSEIDLLGTIRRLGRHEGRITKVSLSHDQASIVSASEDRLVSIWDRKLGDRWSYREFVEVPADIWFSADDAHILASSRNQDVHLIDRKRKAGRRLHNATNPIGFSRDGSSVLSAATDSRIGRWLLVRKSGAMLVGSEKSGDVAFSPDGSTVIGAGPNRALRLWNVSSGEPRDLRGHRAPVLGATFSPNGSLAVSTARNLEVRLWHVASGESVQLPGTAVRTVRFSPDGEWLAAPNHESAMNLWRVATGVLRVVPGSGKAVVGFAFSLQGDKLASVDTAGRLVVWNLLSEASEVIGTAGSFVHSIRWSANGQSLFLGTSSGQVERWNLDSKARYTLPETHTGWVTSLDVATDGKHLVSGGFDGEIHLRDSQGSVIRKLSGHRGAVWDVRFSPLSDLIASVGDDGDLRLWDLDSGTARVFSGHREAARAVSFGAGGDLIASSAADGVWLWNDGLPRDTKELAAWVKRALAASR